MTSNIVSVFFCASRNAARATAGAVLRPEDDSCLYTDFRELLGNQEAMGLVTDDKTVSSHTGHSLETSRCLLQQSLLSGQRQELLRVHCA
jgi:hypothetical protein